MNQHYAKHKQFAVVSLPLQTLLKIQHGQADGWLGLPQNANEKLCYLSSL
jgi:hypothetical protein